MCESGSDPVMYVLRLRIDYGRRNGDAFVARATHAIHKQLGTLIRSLARLPLVTIVEAIANFRQKGAAHRGEPKVYPTTFEFGRGYRETKTGTEEVKSG